MLLPFLVKIFLQDIFSLDPDRDEYYLPTLSPIKQEHPRLFQPTQFQSAIRPNIFKAKDDCI